MSLLSTISKPAKRAMVCTITGDAGLGKTSLAALFPSPIFIRAEDGMQSIPEDRQPDAFPVLSSADDLWPQLGALLREEHAFRTLVIDSVTRLDSMFVDAVLATDKATTINQACGGFGGGPSAVASMHWRVRKAAKMLNETKGMNIVFLAHADSVRVDPPDGESFTRYNLRMMQKSASPYVDEVDLVGFLKLETFDKKAKAGAFNADTARTLKASTGMRLLVCHAEAANVSKNRYGISEALEFHEGTNPLSPYLV